MCVIPSPLLMASLLHDRNRGRLYSHLDSHPWVGECRGTQGLLGKSSVK